METATVNLTALKAVACAASTETTRYSLNGVYLQVEPEHVTYVATDGRILLAHREFMEGDNPNTLVGDWIIPNEICNGKVSRNFPFDSLQQTDDGKLILAVSGRIFAPIQGVFPDWRRVIPRNLTGIAAQHNPALLMRLQKAAGLLLGKSNALTSISHNGASDNHGADHRRDGPALAAWSCLPNTFGVVMPFRGDTIGLPDWFESKLQVAAE